ncbi:MAG: HAMP domain-containing histidine kinase [Deltaproteobacteria bacterium]|nr:HAMP domain-containing histidine kinase [Deltaproteobacteria bacterium]MBW2071563.1 HAMP domain-containing histidine kinase [Deltaproteobacteria bacterium]
MRGWEEFSLRARLVLLYAVLLIFSVVLVGCYSYWNIWQLFISNKSSHLRARAKPIIEHWLLDKDLAKEDPSLLHLDPRDALVLARDLTSRDAVAIVLNRQGEIVANGKRLPEEPTAPPPAGQYLRQALSGKNEITYRSEVNGKPVLVLLIPLRPLPASPQIFGVIQISTLLTDINQILFRHGAMLIAVVAVILILGIAVGFWLIGVSLKDLRSLVTICNQIREGNFTRRAHPKNRRDEIGQLAASFNQMVDQLEATFAAQRRFVANAAHELFTPLTGLRGSLEVLLRGAQDDAAATARLCRGMFKEVNRLIRLCDQLLGLSRLASSANVRKQKIILADFLYDFKQQAQVLAPNRSLIIQNGPFAAVSADPDLLNQILLNLLTNALRYSPPETPVIVGWRLLPGQVEIRLADQGIGMDKETLSHIFEPFYQGKSAAVSGEKGTGLGLALAKSMVAAHGGNLRVASEPGKGTTVYFTLPLE